MSKDNESKIESRGWDIEIKPGDTSKQIETKNKIRKVLEMWDRPLSEIEAATGFSEEEINHIRVHEVTFVLGPGKEK